MKQQAKDSLSDELRDEGIALIGTAALLSSGNLPIGDCKDVVDAVVEKLTSIRQRLQDALVFPASKV
jgi:hypothetical protein